MSDLNAATHPHRLIKQYRFKLETNLPYLHRHTGQQQCNTCALNPQGRNTLQTGLCIRVIVQTHAGTQTPQVSNYFYPQSQKTSHTSNLSPTTAGHYQTALSHDTNASTASHQAKQILIHCQQRPSYQTLHKHQDCQNHHKTRRLATRPNRNPTTIPQKSPHNVKIAPINLTGAALTTPEYTNANTRFQSTYAV